MADEKIIHDPVYGGMRLIGPVLDLVDVPEVQRLRRIHQLGLANAVFPGAHQSRFDHSLGVAHLIGRLAGELDLPEEERDLMLAAAMLHDIGHPPYSHTLEFLMIDYIGMDHVELGGAILRGDVSACTPEEAERLKELGVRSAAEILAERKIDPGELTRLLTGKHEKPYLGQMLNSEVDVDQMDYLMRDAHFTGVALGKIDVDRLLRTITIHRDRLAISHKGIDAVEGLLTARALMFSSVYFHHTTRTAELMFANAVDRAISPDGPITRDNFYRMTDEEMNERLYEIEGYPRDIITRLRYRQLFKSAHIDRRGKLGPDEMKALGETYGKWGRVRELQDEIAERAKVPEGSVILDAPIMEIAISEPRLAKVEVPVLTGEKLEKLSEVSTLATALKDRQTPRYFLRVLTAPKHLKKVAEVAPKVLP